MVRMCNYVCGDCDACFGVVCSEGGGGGGLRLSRYYLQVLTCTYGSNACLDIAFFRSFVERAFGHFTGLHTDIAEQKCYMQETCRFVNRTLISLKTSAQLSHQKRFVILLTYVQLGNHTPKSQTDKEKMLDS